MANQSSSFAALWWRLWAAFLDVSLAALFIPWFLSLSKRLTSNVTTYFATELVLGEGVSQELIAASILAFVVALAIASFGWFFGTATFLALCESMTGATPGKYLLGLGVVSKSEARPSFVRSLFRQNLKSLSIFLCGFGVIMALWSRKRQMLHDKLTACSIIWKQPITWRRLVAPLAISFAAVWQGYPILHAEVSRAIAPLQIAIRSYQAPGLIEQLAWRTVRLGWERLQEEPETSAQD